MISKFDYIKKKTFQDMQNLRLIDLDLELINSQITQAEAELGVLRDRKRMIEMKGCVITGGCAGCQNGHYPSCNEE